MWECAPAKGLEFDAVILFGCIRSNEKNAHMRRKVYLGCTRALHELYFVEREALPEGLRECEGYMEIVDYYGRPCTGLQSAPEVR